MLQRSTILNKQLWNSPKHFSQQAELEVWILDMVKAGVESKMKVEAEAETKAEV